jgi:hypothetical protein
MHGSPEHANNSPAYADVGHLVGKVTQSFVRRLPGFFFLNLASFFLDVGGVLLAYQVKMAGRCRLPALFQAFSKTVDMHIYTA